MVIVIFPNACAPLVPLDQWHTRAIEKEHLFLDQKNPKIAYTDQQPRSWKPIEVLRPERKARQAAYRVKLNLTGEEADVTTSSFADSEASWPSAATNCSIRQVKTPGITQACLDTFTVAILPAAH